MVVANIFVDVLNVPIIMDIVTMIKNVVGKVGTVITYYKHELNVNLIGTSLYTAVVLVFLVVVDNDMQMLRKHS